jgi:DHA2 family multidrug resistance protein
MGMFTSIYLTPVLAQRLLGFSPTQSGLLLLPGSVVAVLVLILTGKLLQSGVPSSLIVLVGFACFIFFNWSMSRISQDITSGAIALNLIFRAIGMATLTVPLATLAISSLEPKDMPQGTALNNMMRQLGGSFGISMVNTYVARRVAAHRLDLLSHVSTDNPIAAGRMNAYIASFVQKGFTLSDAKRNALALMEKLLVKQSFFTSYLDAYLLIGIVFALALPLLVLVRKKKGRPVIIASSDH